MYRYYICLGASRRGYDTCPVRSIAAGEVEGLVIGQVKRLLASPEMVARTITAARRENGAAEDPWSRRAKSSRPSGRSSRCGTSVPGRAGALLRLLIERIDVAPDGISVTLHAAGIRSRVEGAQVGGDAGEWAARVERPEGGPGALAIDTDPLGQVRDRGRAFASLGSQEPNNRMLGFGAAEVVLNQLKRWC